MVGQLALPAELYPHVLEKYQFYLVFGFLPAGVLR